MKQLVGILRGVDNLLGHIAKLLTAVTICIQMIIMFAGVCFRYFLNSPLTWCDELSSYLLVLVTFFGGYVALRTNTLAKVELVINLFPSKNKIRKLLILSANFLAAILLITVVYYGTILVFSPVIMNQRTPAMYLPMFWFYSIIPAASTMMVIRLFVTTYDMFQEEGD